MGERYDEALALVLAERRPSTSFLQRRLSIGWYEACEYIDRMESEGHVSPSIGGQRTVLEPASQAPSP